MKLAILSPLDVVAVGKSWRGGALVYLRGREKPLRVPDMEPAELASTVASAAENQTRYLVALLAGLLQSQDIEEEVEGWDVH